MSRDETSITRDLLKRQGVRSIGCQLRPACVFKLRHQSELQHSAHLTRCPAKHHSQPRRYLTRSRCRRSLFQQRQNASSYAKVPHPLIYTVPSLPPQVTCINLASPRSVTHPCTLETFAAANPTLPVSALSAVIGFDTEQPLNIRGYFACIFASSLLPPNEPTNVLVYKGAHASSPDEAVAELLQALRIELGDIVRTTIARRTPGTRREVWKGKFNLVADVSGLQVGTGGGSADVGGAGAGDGAERPPAYGS